MTREEAVGFLQESGWLQDHDRQIYEQGKRDGIKWHPYPKESPTDVGEYLVTINGKVTIEDATYYEYSGTYQFDSQGVTAWAELPKPYEEGADNE